tara:strand:- start:72 stop:584 length:513 start_codon:yes stop_codon:yes gene_type:complete
MFLSKKILKIFFFLLIFVVDTNAENKVAYLDLDVILTKSNVGVTLFEKLKKIEDQKLTEFNIKEKKLKEEENKIISTKNIISKEQFNLDVQEFQNKLKSYKKSKSEEINSLKKNRKDEILVLLKSINPIIEKYMKENSISMIIDKKNIFIADKNYDITYNVIELINKNIK